MLNNSDNLTVRSQMEFLPRNFFVVTQKFLVTGLATRRARRVDRQAVRIHPAMLRIAWLRSFSLRFKTAEHC
jgi:hypothetical protein